MLRKHSSITDTIPFGPAGSPAGSDELTDLVYFYEYDQRGRTIAPHIPFAF